MWLLWLKTAENLLGVFLIDHLTNKYRLQGDVFCGYRKISHCHKQFVDMLLLTYMWCPSIVYPWGILFLLNMECSDVTFPCMKFPRLQLTLLMFACSMYM